MYTESQEKRIERNAREYNSYKNGEDWLAKNHLYCRNSVNKLLNHYKFIRYKRHRMDLHSESFIAVLLAFPRYKPGLRGINAWLHQQIQFAIRKYTKRKIEKVENFVVTHPDLSNISVSSELSPEDHLVAVEEYDSYIVERELNKEDKRRRKEMVFKRREIAKLKKQGIILEDVVSIKPIGENMSVVTGVLYPWGHITVADEFMGKFSWQCSIKVSEEDAKGLISKGKMPTKKDPLMFLFKRTTTWGSGEAKDTPTCVDANLKPLDGSIVGNGSEGRIQYKKIEGENAFGAYCIFELCAVQVTKLIKYEQGAVDGSEFSDSSSEFSSEDMDPPTNSGGGTGPDCPF